ncbi:MAG: ABC transporter ATP-binding protein [Proteobacteria bacterium]|nr:ABC transporter ATP-binding protein [Pseudomonadota bacterium]
MLTVKNIAAFYGPSQALFDVSLEVGEGEIVTLLGRNGMGKTTTIRSIMGLTRPQDGDIAFRGRSLVGLPPFSIAGLGIGLIPEGRRMFGSLSVRENLQATARRQAGGQEPWTLDRILTLFPRLAERAGNRAATLSGGEQQMLAIGRALMTNPKLLIFDEATEGLAPRIRDEIWSCLETVLKPAGQAILLVDKHLDAMARIADRHYIIEKGRTVWSGTSSELHGAVAVQSRYLGIAPASGGSIQNAGPC